jgi:hypothetical protein
MTSGKPRHKILSSPRRHAAHVPLEQRARPTAERMRRAGAHFERGDTGQITMRDSPLERALARKTITPEQYAAAQKYRHHWYFGGLHDHLGSLDLTRILAGHHGDYSGMARSENQAFHRQRFREAVQAIGKIGSHVARQRRVPRNAAGAGGLRPGLGQPGLCLRRGRRAHEDRPRRPVQALGHRLIVAGLPSRNSRSADVRLRSHPGDRRGGFQTRPFPQDLCVARMDRLRNPITRCFVL